MDAARYARVRELFLAADELPPQQQETFLKVQTAGDAELLEEVLSLLVEHDPESARIEGERATPVPPPSSAGSSSASRRVSSKHPAGQKTTRGDSAGPTHENAGKRIGSEITQHGAQRTHASPREDDETPAPQHAPSSLLWAQRARRSRRRTSTWLWLAALLPTALIGWWTYRQVESTIQQSVRNELKGVADSLTLGSQRFMTDKAKLVQSWSRRPSIRKAIVELVELADSDPDLELLRGAEQTDLIQSQLRMLSGVDDIKFVVWNDSYRTLASSSPDRADVGEPVAPGNAENLAYVMSGEAVLFGPQRLIDDNEGVAAETTRPVMAIIVPIKDDDQRVIAALLVRGIGMFEEFSRMFIEVAIAGDLDAYAINRDGVMVTDSPRAVTMATENHLDLSAREIAGRLRVADPGFELTSTNVSTVQRIICPLTVSVAAATTGNSSVRIDAYNNYAGQSVVGAWRWNNHWNFGIIVERIAERAFAPVRIVRFGFLLLGSLLFMTAFAAAAMIARVSTAERAAVHPLSRYEVISELGSGGMGVVYRAKHRQLGRDTALKVLIGDRRNKEDRLRFDREARLAASLSNPHSVMIYDYGRSEDGEAYCVMEFLRGLTLQEVVARSGHQPVGRVLFILSQICDALAEAHGMNLLHRDIKPQNIMLSLDASVGDWAVVFDYGLAKPLRPVSGVYQTSETIWSGTPMYMAPERFRAPSVMDPRSDVYSVGCVAYYLLSGRPPFIECDPESLFALILSQQPISISIHRNEGVPEEISAMVMRCMAKHVDERYATIEELSQMIDRLRATYSWTVDEARLWWKHHGSE
jgi:hypothetical protein